MIRALLVVILFITSCAGPARLSGTELAKDEAPDFTLTDALNGRSVSLSSLRGSVVAMSFLYTRCPDVCPLTAAQFRAAQRALGGDADRVRFVGVSVDPDGDTPAAVREFSRAHDLGANWHYLIGSREQLRQVWGLYGIGAFAAPTDAGVSHNDAIYLIDARGREREIVHSDIALKDFVNDIRVLLQEK